MAQQAQSAAAQVEELQRLVQSLATRLTNKAGEVRNVLSLGCLVDATPPPSCLAITSATPSLCPSMDAPDARQRLSAS